MAQRLPFSGEQYWNACKRNAFKGACMYTYEAGTTTVLKTTWTTADESIERQNPIQSDANGIFPEVYGTGGYYIVIKNNNKDEIIYQADNIQGVGTISYQQVGSLTGDPDNDAVNAPFDVGAFIETYEYNAGSGVGGGKYQVVSANPSNNLINPAKTDGSGNYLMLLTDGEINVSQAGAVGDGVSEDTNSINAALSVGGIINGNDGDTYLVKRLFPIDNSVFDLSGATLERDVSRPGGGNEYDIDSSDIFISATLSNFTIKNGVINDKHTEDVSSYRAFFTVSDGGYVEDILIEDITFLDSHHGIYVFNDAAQPIGGLRILFRRCKFLSPVQSTVGVSRKPTIEIPYAMLAGVMHSDCIVEDSYGEYMWHLAISTIDIGLPPSKGSIFRRNTIVESGDTSLYVFGERHTIEDNKVFHCGKDGLKVNTVNYSTSKGCVIRNNYMEGAAGRHQSDGGFWIVSTGENNTVEGNEVNINSPAVATSRVSFAAVSGLDSRVINNSVYSDQATSKGLLLYVFSNDISTQEGALVSGNTIKVADTAIAVWDVLLRKFAIVNNILDCRLGGVGLFAGRTVAQDDMLDPLYSTISGNVFIGNSEAAQMISWSNVDRMNVSNNTFSGLRQRDVPNGLVGGNFIGTGNISGGNDPVYFRFATTRQGVYWETAPTLGTWIKGEVASDRVQGWLCTASGTAGTLTGCTVSTTSASKSATVNDGSLVREGNVIDIAGEAGSFTITKVEGNNIELNTAATSTLASVALTYKNPTWSAASPYYA